MKKTLITIVIIVIVGLGIYFATKSSPNTTTPVVTSTPTPVGTTKPTPAVDAMNMPEEVIGTSVESRDITAYHFGKGNTDLFFIAGVHAGSSWNTVQLAYQFMDYLKENPSVIPANVRVTVIPVLNPDSLNKVANVSGRFDPADITASATVLASGRFNANNVDLNRNFDCDWQASAKLQNKTVSGGTSAFSEPETLALKNYVEKHKPTAVVAWYSAAGGVYASNCHAGVLPETTELTKKFADASGYPAFRDYDFYEITGDMTNWFAKLGVPAISVVLTNHTDTEWTKNKAGALAILKYYSK